MEHYRTCVDTPDQFALQMLHKRVQLHFDKQHIELALTHALFSSHQVDAGSHLLLGTLPRAVDMDATSAVLDLGCGVGTLGLAVAARCPHAVVTLRDRDALAVWVTAHNARANGLRNCTAEPALDVTDQDRGAYDLVLSNIPAKAGHPVLQRMLAGLVTALSPTGMGAVVIVKPLAEHAHAWLQKAGASVTAPATTANHTVFHFTGGATPVLAAEPEQLAPYVRGHLAFPGPTLPYQLQTAYGLGEFDQLHFATSLVFDMLRTVSLSGTVMILGADVGHVAAGVRQRATRGSVLWYCSRDALALAFTARNVASTRTAAIPTIAHAVNLQQRHSVDWLVILGDPIPNSPWTAMIWYALSELLSPRGKCLLVARSTAVARILKDSGRRITVVTSKKQAGYRSLLVRIRRRD